MYKIVLISKDSVNCVGGECESVSQCDKRMKEVCKNHGDMYIRSVCHLKTVRVLQFKSSYAKKHNIVPLIGFIYYREVGNV